MRRALANLVGPPDHAGLAHDVYANWEVLDNPTERDGWLEKLVRLRMPPDYEAACRAWKGSLASTDSSCLTGTLSGRLLVGHGNPSPTDVGLTLHHTWGVPVIPGSAIKGVVSHWVHRSYGDPTDRDRRQWSGPSFDEPRRGAGEHYRFMFGGDDEATSPEAAMGHVTFHDALPDYTAEPFLARDVVTVHQTSYYKGRGWPNDYDAPTIVPFLTVRPLLRFTFPISAPAGWRETACRLLVEALGESGVGGKTAAGYGRFTFDDLPTGTTATTSAPDDSQVVHSDSPIDRLQQTSEPEARWRILIAWAQDEGAVADWCRRLFMTAADSGPAVLETWLRALTYEVEQLRVALAARPLGDEQIDLDIYRAAYKTVLSEDGYLDAWERRRPKGATSLKLGGHKLRERARAVRAWPGTP